MRSRAGLIGIAFVLATATLRADMAIGAAAAMLDAGLALGLAPAVLVIEAVVAYRIFRGADVTGALMAVIIANVASAIAGLLFASLAPLDMRFRPISDGRQRDENTLALMALCIPFFALSVVIEFAVARRLVAANHESRAWRWAVQANIVSYVMILAVLLMTLLSIRSARSQGLIASLW